LPRTALVMPAYNEQPSRIMAELQAIDESLRDHAAMRSICSSSATPPIGHLIAEEAVSGTQGRTGRIGFSTGAAPGTSRASQVISPTGSRASAAPIPTS
jgi:hypothetical protein